MLEQNTDSDADRVETGEMVFNEDGEPVGLVTDMNDVGFEVGTTAETELRRGNHEQLPGQEFGEGYLMWRCGDCGKMGKLEHGMPSTCPNCGALEEELIAVEED